MVATSCRPLSVRDMHALPDRLVAEEDWSGRRRSASSEAHSSEAGDDAVYPLSVLRQVHVDAWHAGLSAPYAPRDEPDGLPQAVVLAHQWAAPVALK